MAKKQPSNSHGKSLTQQGEPTSGAMEELKKSAQSSRRVFVGALSLAALGVATAIPSTAEAFAYTNTMSGTGTVDSTTCGTTSFTFEGEFGHDVTSTEITFNDFSVEGEYSSGYQAGTVTLVASGDISGDVVSGSYTATGVVDYTDDFNTDVELDVTIEGTVDSNGKITYLKITFDGDGQCGTGATVLDGVFAAAQTTKV